jgi:hypothetical protein
MRDQGLSNFPDPRITDVGNSHGVVIAVPRNLAAAAVNSAQRACQGILPAPSAAGPTAAQSQARLQDMLSFARV